MYTNTPYVKESSVFIDGNATGLFGAYVLLKWRYMALQIRHKLILRKLHTYDFA